MAEDALGQEPSKTPEPPRESSPVEAQAARISTALQSIADVTVEPRGRAVEVLAPRERLSEVAQVIRDRLGYAYLSTVTAVDWPDRIEVIYLIYSLEQPHGICLKANLPREELPDCPSLTGVWPGAEFQERETYDLMGINFVGHPDLRRILTDDDFPGHPLRKDFRLAADYVLMRDLRNGAEGQLAPLEDRGGESSQ
ncbi:MAG TPA: NADH-quinone oxidoreductase subunit C [Chloroflexota bacterium]|jgi:NADH:ubiquinone oxidoreductase subunit C